MSADANATECSLEDNATCWYGLVDKLNADSARLMTPVVVMMLIFMIVGVFGNIMVLLVYCRRGKKPSAVIYITYLAFTDLFSCIVLHPYVIYKLVHRHNQQWGVLCKVFEYLMHSVLVFSGLALLLIAFDRYFAICRPLQFSRMFKYTKFGIAATVVVGCFISIPILEFYDVASFGFGVDDLIFVEYSCHVKGVYLGTQVFRLFSVFMVSAFLCEIVAMTFLYWRVGLAAYRRHRKLYPFTTNKTPTLAKDKQAATDPAKAAEPIIMTPSTSASAMGASITPTTPTVKSLTTTFLSVASLHQMSKYPRTSESFELNHVGKQPVARATNAQTLSRVDGFSSDVSTPNNGRKLFKRMWNVSSMTTHPIPEKTTKQPTTETKERMQRAMDIYNSTFDARLRAAKLLFVVTAIFFFSWMPFFILRVFYSINPDYFGEMTDFKSVVLYMLNHFFYLNNAVNPILYTMTNKKFRQEWKATVRRWFR